MPLFALVLAACSDGDPGRDAPVPSNVDLSLVEMVPECPVEAESGRPWDSRGDGCPGSVDALVDFATADIAAFWQYELRNHGLPYSPPSRLVDYDDLTGTACGLASNLAFYCPRDAAIYLDSRLMRDRFDAVGPYGPVLILAHEWARLIQGQLSMADAGLSSVELELQADCFAGAYVRRPAADNVYDQAGPTAAATLVFGAAAWSPYAAASAPAERIAWFNRGLAEGLNSCFD